MKALNETKFYSYSKITAITQVSEFHLSVLLDDDPICGIGLDKVCSHLEFYTPEVFQENNLTQPRS